MEVLKEIQELGRKAVMYDNMKGQNDEIIRQLENVELLISDIKTLINPIKSIKHRENSSKGTYSEILQEQYNKLRMGLYISTDTIKMDYPHLNDTQVMTIYMIMKKSPKVLMRRRDYNKRELYLLKEG
jgi:hypothetical protein